MTATIDTRAQGTSPYDADAGLAGIGTPPAAHRSHAPASRAEIGRASCRERVWLSV